MEKLIKLYIDSPQWEPAILPDDFAVAIGKKQSNSVYHIAEVRPVPKPEKRVIRYHIKCFKSDLITCLNREPDQKLIPIVWYNRNKK
tara:strand:- start:24787 stop:25047 length:261 start_codon:yes stop_codon:yes gene_type:complete